MTKVLHLGLLIPRKLNKTKRQWA